MTTRPKRQAATTAADITTRGNSSSGNPLRGPVRTSNRVEIIVSVYYRKECDDIADELPTNNDAPVASGLREVPIEAVHSNNLNPRKSFNEQELEEEQFVSAENPEHSLNSKQLSEVLQSSLMELQEDYRVVVVLRHFSDLSYRDIGEVLHIPEKTVKSRLYSARQIMKLDSGDQATFRRFNRPYRGMALDGNNPVLLYGGGLDHRATEFHRARFELGGGLVLALHDHSLL